MLLAGCESGGGSPATEGEGGDPPPTSGNAVHTLFYECDQTFNIMKIEKHNTDPNATSDWLLVAEACPVIDLGLAYPNDEYKSGIKRFRTSSGLDWNSDSGIRYRLTPGTLIGTTVVYSQVFQGEVTANGWALELTVEMHELPSQ
jgi:hypothetical protein